MQRKKKTPEPLQTDRKFACKYCGTKFSRERTLLNHLCEKKRRWLDKEEKHVGIGFLAYRKFYELSYDRKNIEFGDFVNDRFYTSFVKFGKHVLSINAIEVNDFINFLVKNSVKIDDWCSDNIYSEFVRFQTFKESPDKAISRNILVMEQWARDTKQEWTDFFRNISTARAVDYLKMGRISPWVLYNCKTGRELLGKFSEEQFSLVMTYINPKVWEKKFEDNPQEVNNIESITRKSGF